MRRNNLDVLQKGFSIITKPAILLCFRAQQLRARIIGRV